MKKLIVSGMFAIVLATNLIAGKIGYIETFSLSKNRDEALKQLIPGTKDYYYYTCLHLQNEGKFADVESVLKSWIKRHNYSTRVYEIKNRQALLQYSQSPKKSLEYLRHQLGLHFSHQKEVMNPKYNYPTKLSQDKISFKTLKERAFRNYRDSVNGFTDTALDRLARESLTAAQRRALLKRLVRPDIPNLPKMVTEDLKVKHSRGFGAYTIHRNLTLKQLNSCLHLRPSLLKESRFINIYLNKLRPSNMVDWRNSPAQKKAYLNRLYAFTNKLPASYNSLKANVLYHLLKFNITQDTYDKKLFLEYLKLPRQIFYVNPKYIRRGSLRYYRIDFNGNFESLTSLPPIYSDYPLIQTYLQHFFINASSYNEFELYLRDTILKENFATAKILNGIGNQEDWYSMLSPTYYKTLKERVDLTFAATIKKQFSATSPVSLKLNIKNVKKLFIKIYKLNLFNYYKQTKSEPNMDINLEGLVTNWTRMVNYTQPPLRRHQETFDFPELKSRGIYVIEFIGGGKTSRALIRKGQLRFHVQTTAAGHVFTVLDEAKEIVKNASIWLGGHLYKAEQSGIIGVPFTNKPGTQKIIITDGTFSSLGTFYHESETYDLKAGIFVPRESLVKGKKATLLVRPMLYINETPVTLSILKNTKLTLTSTDIDGTNTVKVVDNVNLSSKQGFTYEFFIPEGLNKLGVSLSTKVRCLSKNKTIDLEASRTFTLNSLDATNKIDELLLQNSNNSFYVSYIGKDGSRKKDRPVDIRLYSKYFKNPVVVNLKSSAKGLINLGALKDIHTIRTKTADSSFHFTIPESQITIPSQLNILADKTTQIPVFLPNNTATELDIALFEVRGNTFYRNCFDSLSFKNGYLTINKLPTGNYQLFIKESNQHINIAVFKGKKIDDLVITDLRVANISPATPLQIEKISTENNHLTVKLANADAATRIHVFPTYYIPSFKPFEHLNLPMPSPFSQHWSANKSLFQAGIKVGEEYNYIIKRRYAALYPGNMLERPGLLLNPFELRKTQTTATSQAKDGGRFRKIPLERTALLSKAPAESAARHAYCAMIAPRQNLESLDFLATAAPFLTNLLPDKNGIVRIPLKNLGHRQDIQILAVNDTTTIHRHLALKAEKMRLRKIQLAKSFDPAKHVIQVRKITPLPPERTLVINDIFNSKFEVFDSIPKAFSLYLTLLTNHSNAKPLDEFEFITRWPTLKESEKQKKYSKYACHELNLFIYHHDQVFFQKTVKPFIINKMNKTFIDRWLTNDNLKSYFAPAFYRSRLNIVEKIMLGQVVKGELATMQRFVKDAYNMLPPNPERFNMLFDTALKTSAMDDSGTVGEEKEFEESIIIEADEDADGYKPSASPPKKAEFKTDILKKLKNDKSARNTQITSLSSRLNLKKSKRRSRNIKRLRHKLVQYYRKMDQTKEWTENNYYKLPLNKQNNELVTVNSYWYDYSKADRKQPFLSANFADASHSFTEIMLAIATIDLPFKGKYDATISNNNVTIKAGKPVIVFHSEIEETKTTPTKNSILVAQNYVNIADRYRYENNERFEKFIKDEFIVNTVYACKVVITNPTVSPRKIDVLLQIPSGAVPVKRGFYTTSRHLKIGAYSTKTMEYNFYFPKAGQFNHYPIQVSCNEKLVGFAKPTTLKVVTQPSTLDKTSWQYISQNGTEAQILSYLKSYNLNRTNLNKIAFRMRDRTFFETTLKFLKKQHTYNDTLWSYSLFHNTPEFINEYLPNTDLAKRSGAFLISPLLIINPVKNRSYQYFEYKPFVNPRRYQLGKFKTIQNEALFTQYNKLLTILSYKKQFSCDNKLSVSYYLLLQNRVKEAIDFFRQVDTATVKTTIQYDYCQAYIDFYLNNTKSASRIANKYNSYPVLHWQNRFREISNQIQEIVDSKTRLTNKDNRQQQMTEQASKEPTFDFKIDNKAITVTYRNIAECQVNYYLMDIEFLFSKQPFSNDYSTLFSFIQPNKTQSLKFNIDNNKHTFELPKEYQNKNCLIEITGAGKTETKTYFANSMTISMEKNFGQLKLTDAKSGSPLNTVYVKVYAKLKNGNIIFYKDGYTDLRGRFAYAALNTDELSNVNKFAILIMSKNNGSTVKEATPPKQ